MTKKNTFSYLLVAIASCFFTTTLSAQINKGGQPLSYDAKIGLPSLKTIDTYLSPALDMAVIEAENAAEEKKSGIRYIGKLRPANKTLQNSGTWTELGNGDRVWRLKIVAQNALAITLYYDDFQLAKGGKMFVFSSDGQERYGAFTEENNNTQRLFVTAMTHTDECIIEYFEPAAARGEGVINIGRVAHAYRDVKSRALNAANAAPTAVLASGACNVDINCPEGATWQDQKHAVITLLTTANANQAFCSGAMINNARQDCTPYMLTANHCISGNTAADYAQMAFYFNHEAAVCGGTVESTNQIVAGSVFCSAAGGNGVQKSDFALLKLTSAIPAAANVYFSGWDANDVPSPSGVSIHHPAGDVKKISTYAAPLVSTNYSNPAAGTTHWHTFWVATQTNYGITEGGSSGSPLFNNAKRIVGDLSGGPSSCTATDKSDYYGKLSYSWTSCGATSDLQLKPWLDPDNTGILALDGTFSPCSGFLLAAAPLSKSICVGSTDSIGVPVTINGTGSPVSFSVSGLPANVTATFAPSTVSATGSTSLRFTIGAAATGSYSVVVTGTQGTSTQSKTVTLVITAGVPTAPTLNSPLNGATGSGYTPTLTWATMAGATSYQVEVATDNAFNTIVATTSTAATASYTVSPALVASTPYFWRVRAVNGCGVSANSATFGFTTGILQCATLNNTTSTAILDTATVTSTLSFPATGTVSSVRILGLQGTHSYTGDLTFVLISPQGTRVPLLAALCGSNNDFNLSLDDAATTTTIPCPLTGGGTYKPSSPFAALNGENAQGNWVLEIKDAAPGDTGNLLKWSLAICVVSNSPSCLLTVNASPTTRCSGDSATAVVANGTGATTAYTWNTGATTATITNLAAGVYTVTATNGGCSATNSITVSARPTVTISGATTACTAVVLTASGGTSYTWSSGTATTPIVVGARRFTVSGTFTVTVTSAAGCTNSSTMAVTVNPLPVTTFAAGATTGCMSVSASLNPLTSTDTYAWSGGNAPTASTNTFTTSATYTVTVSSAAGCTKTATRVVVVSTMPTAAISGNTNIACAGGSTILTATGGGTYRWNTNQTTASITVSPTVDSIYTVTVTSGACSTTATASVSTPPAAITVTQAGTDQTVISPPNGTIQVTASGGVPPYTFVINTVPIIDNGTGLFEGLAAGNYTVTVTDSNGCTTTSQGGVIYNVATNNLPSTVQQLVVSPNPNQGQFIVKMRLAEAAPTEIEVIDLMGRVLKTAQSASTTEPTFNLDLTEFAAELYFVRVHIGTERTMLKVTILK